MKKNAREQKKMRDIMLQEAQEKKRMANLRIREDERQQVLKLKKELEQEQLDHKNKKAAERESCLKVIRDNDAQKQVRLKE